jgi:HlyD family secretion protein
MAMTPTASDLSVLSRKPDAVGATTAAAPRSAIPMPPRKWLTSVVVPGGLVLSALGIILFASAGTWMPATPVHIVPVIVKSGAGGSGSGAAIVQAPGWVEADPYPISVSALTDGIVSEVLVLEGQKVTAGQVVAKLVRIDAELALLRAKAELAEKDAALDSSKATLDAAQRTWDNPVELTRQVAAAESMLAEREGELIRWPSDVAAEQAKADELEAELARLEKLYEQQQAGEIEFIRSKRQTEAQQAVLKSLTARKAILEAQARAAKAEVRAASENLKLRIPEKRALDEARANLGAAQGIRDRTSAALKEAELRLERMDVRSPVDGVVLTRLVQPGSKVMLSAQEMTSSQIVRLYDPQHLQVRVDIPLADAGKVDIGQKAEVIVNVLPDRTFQGRISRIVSEADVQKNTLQVKVAIEDPSPQLKPEMLTRARFYTSATATSQPDDQSVFAMNSLIQHHPGGHTYVWRIDRSKSLAREQSVTLGNTRIEDWVLVTEGLSPGDQLIADPPTGLRDGQKVNVLGEMAH